MKDEEFERAMRHWFFRLSPHGEAAFYLFSVMLDPNYNPLCRYLLKRWYSPRWSSAALL